MSIGVSWHHSVGDMHTLMLFLKAWAAAVNRMASDKPLMIGSRKDYLARFLLAADPGSAAPLVRHYGRLALAKTYAKLMFASVRTQQRFFYFSTHELGRMRADLSASIARELSLNDCICAHLGHALVNAGCGQPSIDLVITVNYRKRLGLSAMACGNLSHLFLRRADLIRCLLKLHLEFNPLAAIVRPCLVRWQLLCFLWPTNERQALASNFCLLL